MMRGLFVTEKFRIMVAILASIMRIAIYFSKVSFLIIKYSELLIFHIFIIDNSICVFLFFWYNNIIKYS